MTYTGNIGAPLRLQYLRVRPKLELVLKALPCHISRQVLDEAKRVHQRRLPFFKLEIMPIDGPINVEEERIGD